MSNHWDGAQIKFVSIISLTTRAESLPTPILPQLLIQIFGITDAKERMKIHVFLVLIPCRVRGVCVSVCVFAMKAVQH